MHIAIQTISDEGALIEQAKKDPEKFKVLYERYHEQIYLFMVRKVIDKELAADLTSEVFLKCLVGLKKYKVGKVPFVAWLYRIAMNEAGQYFRKNKKQQYVILDDLFVNNLVSEIGGVELEESELKQLLAQVVQTLKTAEIQVIELRFYEEKSFKEVAQILDISENNAKVRTYRALEKLRKRFDRVN